MDSRKEIFLAIKPDHQCEEVGCIDYVTFPPEAELEPECWGDYNSCPRMPER